MPGSRPPTRTRWLADRDSLEVPALGAVFALVAGAVIVSSGSAIERTRHFPLFSSPIVRGVLVAVLWLIGGWGVTLIARLLMGTPLVSLSEADVTVLSSRGRRTYTRTQIRAFELETFSYSTKFSKPERVIRMEIWRDGGVTRVGFKPAHPRVSSPPAGM